MYVILPGSCVWLCPIGVPAQDIAKYARSIDAADTTLAAQVWSPSPDVSFIHLLGHEHGFRRVQQDVYVRAMGDMFSERRECGMGRV
jgi:hypothetical protein